MRQDRFSKENLFLYTLGLVPVIWSALLVAPTLSGGLPEILKNLTAAISNPFYIVWMEDTVKCILIFVAAYVLCIGMYLSTARNYRRREEHGSAKWGNSSIMYEKLELLSSKRLKRITGQNFFHFFIPSRKCIVVTGRKHKNISAVTAKFAW